MTEIAEKNQQMDVEILIRIAQIASSKLEIREVLDSIANVVAESFKKDLCSICLLKPEQKVICIEQG
jgi:signal transduction protein with GAF and PtsI domain